MSEGSISRTLKSEPVPDYEAEPGEPSVIIASNLEEKAFRSDRDVLLNIFAPWCGHCKNFSPNYRKIARKVHLLNMSNKILVATYDGTANEPSVPEINWDGFPTILFIKAGTRSPIQYLSPNRDAASVYKWVLEHSTYQDQLDQELGDVGKNDL